MTVLPKIALKDIRINGPFTTTLLFSEKLEPDTVMRMVDDILVYCEPSYYTKSHWMFMDLTPYNLSMALKGMQFELPGAKLEEMILGFEFFDEERCIYYSAGRCTDEILIENTKTLPDGRKMQINGYEIVWEDDSSWN